MNKSHKLHKLALSSIQPSQLYISQEKLHSVNVWLDSLCSYDDVVLTVLITDDDVILLDGHTRAYALWCRGVTSVLVSEVDDIHDLQGYFTCVSWCQEAQIYEIKDLHNRIMSQKAYEVLWIKRCESIFK